MKVTAVETILVRNIEPYIGGKHWLFVQLMTDEGIIGLGERPTMHAANLGPAISMIVDFCEQFVIGRDPLSNRKYLADDLRLAARLASIPACI